MINQFSTEATAVVFDRLANSPDIYERVQALVQSAPAKAPQEIRTFVRDFVTLGTSALGNDLAKDLIDTALRDVRWEEIRAAFQREAH